MLQFLNRVRDNMPNWKYYKNGLWYIDKSKISERDYIKYTKEKHGICEGCCIAEYRMNTGWAQFCEEHAPTMMMDTTPEEYEKKYGISLNQIRAEQANIKIEHK